NMPVVPGGIPAQPLARRIDEFLSSRGYSRPPATNPPPAPAPPQHEKASGPAAPNVTPAPATAQSVEKPCDFVCEDDVRQAVRQGRKIVIGERTIVTPAARDLAEQHRVFVQASW